MMKIVKHTLTVLTALLLAPLAVLHRRRMPAQRPLSRALRKAAGHPDLTAIPRL